MRENLRRALSVLLLLTFFAGCDRKDASDASGEEIREAVSLLELPVSLRAGPLPSNAVGIQISPSALIVDGKIVSELASGRLAPSDRASGEVSALASALSSSAGRRSASIRVHVNTPYETTVAVLRTLAKQGFGDVAFEVRRGSTMEAGSLALASFAVVSDAEAKEPTAFPGEAQRPWDAFVKSWGEMSDACRRAHSVDCDGAPEAPAEGGNVQIRLWARGRGLKLELERFGAATTAAKSAAEPVAMIEGVPSLPAGAPPVSETAVDGAFTWRFEAATDANSPIASAMRPLCGAHPCGVVVSADSLTPTMRVLSFLGAAFPDGTPAPTVRFVAPAE